MTQSRLQQERKRYIPKLPKCLEEILLARISKRGEVPQHEAKIANMFPHLAHLPPLEILVGDKIEHLPKRFGVVFSGGQAPGGHNVIAGLYDAMKKLNSKSLLFGFLEGPGGIIDNNYVEITSDLLDPYRNQGGFDLIGSGRTKIETEEQLQAAEKHVRALNLDGLVVIGGDDSNTNAAILAERFLVKGCKTCVVGVPKTIDGDLKNEQIEISFGFDTACKIYSETIGNLLCDALSAKKYYFFVKLMGRSASHIALECALQTHPNLTLIGEAIAQSKSTLKQIVDSIADLICERAAKNKNYGVILIPEGIIEFIPEVKTLIKELNTLLAVGKEHAAAIESLTTKEEKNDYIAKWLSASALNCFKTLSKDVQAQLLLGRDAHGNVQVSKIETERMLIDMVKAELKRRTKAGTYTGSFSPQPLFCGYEGRSCLPSNFDSQYCYSLGATAALLIDAKATGYICLLKNLAKPVAKWQAGGYPLTAMMALEERHGTSKPVIKKALVNLQGKPYEAFLKGSPKWALEDDYLSPGPIQFFGAAEITDAIPMTLTLEQSL